VLKQLCSDLVVVGRLESVEDPDGEGDEQHAAEDDIVGYRKCQ